MLEKGSYRQVRDMLLCRVSAVGKERADLETCAGRILAEEAVAAADNPPFDRSPYDGYAFRARDTEGASASCPVTLRLVDYIAAGDVAHTGITKGTAAHLMTGAPIPPGADAVLPFERTEFTDRSVTISSAVKAGENVVRAGEDVKKGTVLCRPGTPVDAGLAGTLAGLGIFHPLVYRQPLVGIISTGTELLEEDEPPADGRIYNTNRYALQAACAQAGCRTLYLGTARDEEGVISGLIRRALSEDGCDAVILSGGVSVGDYDCTPSAMERAGVEVLARGLSLKPGMAGAFGIFVPDPLEAGTREENSSAGAPGIPVLALSGNPAACMTAFYAVALPVLKKRAGCSRILPDQVRVRLDRDYSRKNQSVRLLRGRVEAGEAVLEVTIPEKQGNQMLGSLAGSNVFVEIPAGTALRAGETAEGFLIG